MSLIRLISLVSFLGIGFVLFKFRPLGGKLDLIFLVVWALTFVWWLINAIRNYVKYR